MYDFVRDLIAVMQANPILRRRAFFTGDGSGGDAHQGRHLAPTRRHTR